jgi:putative methanogenesis marker protein 8
MRLELVISEMERVGEYWRGDSSVKFGDGIAELELMIKDHSLIGQLFSNIPPEINDQIKYSTPQEILNSTKLPSKVEGNKIKITNYGTSLREAVSPLVDFANSIQYPDVHITRRAGSYILILNGEAVHITKSVIEYCPLAKKIFIRDTCKDCRTPEEKLLKEMNEQAIKEFKMFSGERHLSECEVKVAFGASETTMDAMRKGYIDCMVQVCDGVGTVITSSPESTQGVGAVMTGTFYTTPIERLIERCYEEDVFPVFPETANIDQRIGVEAAIRLGKKKIAVSTAADYNRSLAEIAKLEKDDVEIYKFALCSTGIDEKTARIMAEYSDIAWSCASKYAREIIAPKSLIQIGTKIPAYVMTQRGWNIAKNRLLTIDPNIRYELEKITLGQGERYFIAHEGSNKLIVRPMSELNPDKIDSPRPLV